MFIFFWVASVCCTAQDAAQLARMSDKVSNAANDEERINALTELSDYYSVFNLGDKADSVLQKALLIAEVSNDRTLVAKLLINNTVNSLNSLSNKKSYEKCLVVLQNGLRYARDVHNTHLEALAYIRIAGIYRRENLYDDALQNATKAMTALSDAKDADSIRIELFCELGDIYFARSEGVSAYKNYNTASEIAYRIKNIRYQSLMDHRFSELYKSLNKNEVAKEYLMESLSYNKSYGNKQGEFMDYIDLARLTNKREYIERASSLAARINSPRARMQAKRLMYFWYMVVGKNSKETFRFLESNPEVVQYFANADPWTLTWQKGNIYKFGGQYDSALFFYRAVEKDILAANNPGVNLDTYHTIAETYLQNGDPAGAITYYEKAFVLAGKFNQLELLDSICLRLGELSAKNGYYESAYIYSIRADSIDRILEANASNEDIALLEIDREKKKAEMDRMEIQNKVSRGNNLQIMAITIFITLFFALMLFIGMFEVSKTTIKTLGYFAFISLFEFIVLLLDHPIIAVTKNQPLKVWLVKIGLIALLVPLQHFLEKKMISYLQSRKLLEARKKFSLKNLWGKSGTPSPPTEESIEDSTAVL